MNVAVDAMGGDKAPEVVVQGAVEVADAPGIHVTLVGDREAISDVLFSYSPRIISPCITAKTWWEWRTPK